jgi:hypothetical protein
MKSMKTLLQQRATRLYFQSPGRWTCRQEEAFDFGSMSRAIRFAKGADFRKMDLALACEQPESLTRIPLETVCCGPQVSRPFEMRAAA